MKKKLQKDRFPPIIHVDVEFPVPFPCELNLLNKVFSLNIENLKCFVAFPKLHPEFNAKGLFKLENKYLVIPDKVDERLNRKPHDWGEIYQLPLSIVFIRKLRLWSKVKDRDKFTIEGDFLYEKLPIWKNIVLEYLMAFTKMDLFKRYVSGGSEGISMDFWIKDGNKMRTTYPISKHKTETIELHEIEDDDVISEKRFKIILKEARWLKEVPIQYQLLNNARHEYNFKNYRKAFIDLSTCTEIIFTEMIDAEIKRNVSTAIFQDSIMDNMNSLSSKYKFLNKLGIELPQIKDFRYDVNLINLRNRCVHAAYNPGKHQVEKGLLLCVELLKLSNPIE